MGKRSSTWATDVIQQIVCGLQLKFDKALLFFKKRVVVPLLYNTMLKLISRETAGSSFQYCVWGGGEVWWVKLHSRLACVPKRQKCNFVLRLLPMIAAFTGLVNLIEV